MTFPVRVFKLLGVDTIIRTSLLVITYLTVELTRDSDQCGGWTEPRVRSWRHDDFERRKFNQLPSTYTQLTGLP